jgi:uncharacterized protein (TIGR02996 family)
VSDVYAEPEYAALIAAVRADHEDDVRRLAVADWLAERGEHDRAEFVRVQVEVGRVNPAQHAVRCNCKGCQLRRREDDLLTRLADHFRPAVPWSWAVGLYLRSRCDTPQSAVRRGFVEAVTCPADAWLRHGDTLYRREPVAAVTLTTVPDGDGWEALRHDGKDGWEHPRWEGVEFTLTPVAAGIRRWREAEHAERTALVRGVMDRMADGTDTPGETIHTISLLLAEHTRAGADEPTA